MKAEDLESILSMINNLNSNMFALLQGQQVSNWLAVSMNPNVPESVRQDCLNRAMYTMKLNKERSPFDFSGPVQENSEAQKAYEALAAEAGVGEIPPTKSL